MIKSIIEGAAGRFFIPAALCIVLLISFVKVIGFSNKTENLEILKKDYIEGYVYDSCTFDEGKLVFVCKEGMFKNRKFLLLTNKLEPDIKKIIEEGAYIKIHNPTRTVIQTKPSRNFGEFDQRKYLASKNICCQIKPENSCVELINTKLNFKIAMAKIRKSMYSSLNNVLGEKNASTAMAVITGDTGRLESRKLEEYRASGIAHIMAVSGMHVGFVQSGTRWILSKFKMNYAGKKIITVIIILLFGGLADFSPSITRAILQSCYILVGKIVRRPVKSFNSLSVACTLQLLNNPYLLFSNGFILSYVAILSIMVIEPMISYREFFFGKIPGWLTSGLSVNLGLFPLLVTYVNTFSPVGVIATLFAGKAACAICLSGIAVWLVACLPFGSLLTEIPAAVTSVALVFLDKITETGSGLPAPLGAFNVPSISKFTIVIYYCLILIILNKKAVNYIKKKFIHVCLISIAVAVAFAVHFRSTNIVFFDVGQGLSVMYKSEDVVGLVDTGEGKVDVSTLLLKQGVGDLDFVLLTHGHSDHTGGFEKVASEHDIDRLYVPDNIADEGINKACEVAKSYGIEIVRISNNCSVQYGDTLFQFIVNNHFFGKTDESDINNASVLMIAENSDGRAVFTGDIQEETESYVAENGLFADSEILQVAHHGSNTGSLHKNISIISPECAIISVGEKNSYGHPANEVLETLSKVGADIKRSDLCGSVRVMLRKGKVSTWQKLKTSK